MDILVKNDKYRFKISVSGKYNFFIGDSGSHKTHFLNMVANYLSGSTKTTCEIVGDLGETIINVTLLKNDVPIAGDYHDLFTDKEGTLFIIDESSSVLKERDISRVIKESKNYFIFLTRVCIGWLPVSIDSLYVLKKDSKEITNYPMYCKSNGDLSLVKKIDCIITEDSESGRQFFESHFPSKTVFRGHLSDNSTISNSTLHEVLYQMAESYDNILVAFDASAYGNFYDLLLDTITDCRKNISIIAWDSFESYILSCPRYNTRLDKTDVNYKYCSLEQLGTRELKSRLSGYDKRALPSVIKTDESFIQDPVNKIY